MNIDQSNLPSSFNGFGFLGVHCCSLCSDTLYHLQLRTRQWVFIQGCITFLRLHFLSSQFNLTLRRIVCTNNSFLPSAPSCGLRSITRSSPWLPFCSRFYAMIFSQSRADPFSVFLRKTKLTYSFENESQIRSEY